MKEWTDLPLPFSEIALPSDGLYANGNGEVDFTLYACWYIEFMSPFCVDFELFGIVAAVIKVQSVRILCTRGDQKWGMII